MKTYRTQNIILSIILVVLCLCMVWLYMEGIVDGALGTACYKIGWHDTAVSFYIRALEKDPENPKRHRDLQGARRSEK